MRKTVVTMLLVLMAVFILVGCGGTPESIAGLWYEETGYGGTLEFKDKGVCTKNANNTFVDGKFTFDTGSSQGEITFNYTGEKKVSRFILENEKLTVDDTIYTREEIEPKDLTDKMEDWEEKLEDTYNDWFNKQRGSGFDTDWRRAVVVQAQEKNENY